MAARRPGRRCTGTVEAVDPPGLPTGVKVQLDEEISGVTDCYASHAELEPAEEGSRG